jgi:tRNA nucleotidyltransferase (CCA-adding enzyme)
MALRTIRPDDIPAHIIEACARLGRAGYEAWLVGGAVRDLHAGRAAKDFDIATSATPDQMVAVFGRKRTIPTGEKHGTMTVLVDRPDGKHEPVEVTTFRGEGAYSDGRRPDSVAFVSDLVEDLRRRDFTMNAIAFDPIADRVADPFGGRVDLEAGIIRAVGTAIDRFREDGLRAMRAVRFAAQLGFRLEAETEAAIPRARDVFRKVSAERVRDELVKILMAPKPSVGLDLMERTGLLADVIPELCEGVGFTQNRHHAHDVWRHTLAAVDETRLLSAEEQAATKRPAWIIRAASLFHDVGKPRTAAPKEGAPGEHTFYRHDEIGAEMTDAILKRLRFSNDERAHVVHLVRNHMFWYSGEWTDGTVRRFLGRIGPDAVGDLFALREADVRARGRGEDPEIEIGELRARIEKTIAESQALKVGDLAITGADVMRILAIPPGRIVGEVLRALLERVLDDASLNTPERLAALVPEVAASLRR